MPLPCDSSKTSILLNQINNLDNQLTTIKVRNQHEVAYYQSRIEELEANSSHAFKYTSEIQAYVEKKISSLEFNLYYAQANLQRVQKEITKWRDLFFQLKDNVAGMSMPTPPVVYPSTSHCICLTGNHSHNIRPSTSSMGHYICGPNCIQNFGE